MEIRSIRAGTELGSARRAAVPFLALLVLFTGACTEKARVIQLGAAQFETEALAAIDRIDSFRLSETQVPPLTPEAATASFIGLVEGWPGPISRRDLKIISEPISTTPGNSEAEWQAFLQELRGQYTTFSRTFASLDKGSLFAAPAVEKTIPHLDKLVAQMAAFARSIRDTPAEFTRVRAGIAEAIEATRGDASLSRDQRRGRFRELERQLRDVMAAEQEMTRAALEQCLKTVQVGVSLRTLLVDYGELSLADIADGMSVAFALASDVSGKDLSSLQGKTDAVIAEIAADPDLSVLLDRALGTIAAVRS